MISINQKREFIDDSSFHDRKHLMYNKILVPLEGTDSDQALLEHVRMMAMEFGAALVLIQLYRVMKENDPFFDKIQVEAGSRGYRKKEKGEVYLAELERSLNQDGIDVSTFPIMLPQVCERTSEAMTIDFFFHYHAQKQCSTTCFKYC